MHSLLKAITGVFYPNYIALPHLLKKKSMKTVSHVLGEQKCQ